MLGGHRGLSDISALGAKLSVLLKEDFRLIETRGRLNYSIGCSAKGSVGLAK